ncbi:hypothetical protein [Vibrio cyclitrophicus]|uniref:hypothetical protein n=1 Tax=Vibrio cyclitrophicus TaxID=47951 RepID=UPI000C851E7B|nr:hypothetical protein [Vibrio cyclitrophicus]PMF28422.1 hypothetical protein BCV17_16180 [Vibrio cyclitrophicus]
MTKKADIWLDRAYKICAPLMLLVVTYSYFNSVKPIFDKQQELNEKSSLVDVLSADVQNLKKDKKAALDSLDATNSDLANVQIELKDNQSSLAKVSQQLISTSSELTAKQKELLTMQSTVKNQNKQIIEKENELAKLQNDVQDMESSLSDLRKSLIDSENAAITFYVYRVVNEVASKGVMASVYRSSSDKFNLYNILMDKSEFDESEETEEYSQKYYENQAKKLIRQFTIDNISKTETSYKPAFDLYLYNAKNQLGMAVD